MNWPELTFSHLWAKHTQRMLHPNNIASQPIFTINIAHTINACNKMMIYNWSFVSTLLQQDNIKYISVNTGPNQAIDKQVKRTIQINNKNINKISPPENGCICIGCDRKNSKTSMDCEKVQQPRQTISVH